MSRLAPRWAIALFALGACGGLIGDAAHVATGTTTYLAHGVPFVWRSALWFLLAVGAGTVALAQMRLLLGGPAPVVQEPIREGVAAVASVLAIYAVTALVHDEAEGAATTLVVMLAALTATRFASGWAALACGLAAAIVGPLAEIILVKAGVSEYAPTCDGLFGVPLWLPALYFAFGVVVARLTELIPSDSPR